MSWDPNLVQASLHGEGLAFDISFRLLSAKHGPLV